jgi:hypothetical protein
MTPPPIPLIAPTKPAEMETSNNERKDIVSALNDFFFGLCGDNTQFTIVVKQSTPHQIVAQSLLFRYNTRAPKLKQGRQHR